MQHSTILNTLMLIISFKNIINIAEIFIVQRVDPSNSTEAHRLPCPEKDDGGSNPGLVMWDLWWNKVALGQVSPSTSVSPANLHSTNFTTITTTITRGWYNRPVVAAVPKVPPRK
jgi:hypothetical protein